MWAVWDSLTFAINGLVFVLIGLQLPYVGRNSGIWCASTCVVRRVIQRHRDRAAAFVDVPWRVSRVFHSFANFASEYCASISETDFRGWMDEHARGCRAGGGYFLAGNAGEWQRIPGAEFDYLSDLQRDFFGTRVARTDAASADPRVGTG